MAVTTDGNGRLKLTFAQIAWAVSILVGIGGFWAQVNFRLSSIEELIRETRREYVTRTEVILMLEAAKVHRQTLEERVSALERRVGN